MLTKNQIDKLGYQLRDGQIDATVIQRLEAVRQEYLVAYRHVEEVLAHKVGYRLTGRPAKSTLSIIEKLRRESARLSQIQDIAGCRIVAENIVVQDNICENIAVLLDDVTKIDRRLKPTNGYRAVHLVARHEGWPVEIQVRTQIQHAWAEISEKIADRYGQGIKYGVGEPWAIEFLSRLSHLGEKLEKEDGRLIELRTNRSFALQEAARHRRSARKVIEDAERGRRLVYYKIREHFASLANR